MAALTILFWTLVSLLAVLMFAIEAGAASRHRTVVMCTIASTLLSVLYIMFVIDDRTKFDFKPTEDVKKKKGGSDNGSLGGGGGGGGAKKGGKFDDQDDAAEDVAGDGDDDAKPAPKTDAEMGLTFQDCPECPMMVRVPAGRFLMGSPASEAGRNANEGPQREIVISPEFAVSKSPITREQFTKFVSATGYEATSGCIVNGKLSGKHNWRSPGFEQSHAHPVVCVSLGDTEAYLQWLETKTKKRYRLLSEAEWEYAARAGTTTPYWRGSSAPAEQFNFGRTRDGTLPTTFTPSNALDLHDVNGNVAQWVRDCWQPTLAKVPVDGSPYKTNLPTACNAGVTRGGSWASRTQDARSATRGVVDYPSLGYHTIGIRVARELEPATPRK